MHEVRTRTVQILGIFIICLLMLVTIIGTYQIVTRYFSNKPSTVSEELLAYSFAWIALLASTYMFGKRGHVRMGFLADKISGSIKEYLEIAIDLPILAFVGVVIVHDGIFITKLTMIQTTASLRAPIGHVYAVVPVTGIIIIMFSLTNAADMLHTNFSKEEDTGV